MSEVLPDNPGKSLGKKVGPLPLWAYAAIVAGGAWLLYWWRNNKVGTAAPVFTDPTAQNGFSSVGNVSGPGLNDSSAGHTSTFGGAQPASRTNAQWARDVADGMIASGSSPSDVNNAIAKYMSGGSLNTVESAIINQALRSYGNPPEGLIPANTVAKYTGYLRDAITGAIFGVTDSGQRVWLTPQEWGDLGKPSPTSSVQTQYSGYARDDSTGKIYGLLPTGQRIWLSADQYAALGHPPVTQHFTGDLGSGPSAPSGSKYTVKSGDTAESIARAFYGADGTAVTITNANPGKSIIPGAVLTIP